MSTWSRIDPQLRVALESVPTVDYNAGNLEDRRTKRLVFPKPADDYGVVVEQRTIPGPSGAPDLRLLIFRPQGLTADAPALFFIHGGGYVVGSPESFTHRPLALAAQAGCLVISTSYRLAPETPWPGAVQDVYAAFCWTHAHASALGIDANRIAIYGESAGGGHAAALALYARSRGGPKICLQLLNSPMIDDRPVGHPASTKDNPATGEFVWTRASNSFGWSSLLGVPAGSDDVPSGSVPARVEDLSDLPPTFICTGELDLFCDENIQYANRLSRAGVPTGLFVAPGAYHGFDTFNPEAEVSKFFLATMVFALKQAFRRSA